MNNETNPLREEFETETGITWINSQGEPDIDYVDWLERKVQSQSLPAVEQPEKSTSAKDFELIAFAHYVQDCIRFKGELTYPEHKALVQAWKETYKSQQPSQPEMLKNPLLEKLRADVTPEQRAAWEKEFDERYPSQPEGKTLEEVKYRLGRKLNRVILTQDGTKEIAVVTFMPGCKELAEKVVKILNDEE